METSVRYGAIELKEGHNKRLSGAFALTLALYVGGLIAYLGLQSDGVQLTLPIRQPRIPNDAFKVENKPSQQPAKENAQPRQNGATNAPAAAIAARVGSIPTPIPDHLLPDDSSEIVVTQVGNFNSEPGGKGTSIGLQEGSSDSGKPTKIQATSLGSEQPEFIPHEREPEFDMDDLRSRIRYPELARRNQIQGNVVVSVFVGTDGRPTRAFIDASEASVLNQAAIEAVMATRFTPAEQNGQPVGVWLWIPVNFTLN